MRPIIVSKMLRRESENWNLFNAIFKIELNSSVVQIVVQIKKQLSTFVHNCLIFKWAHLGMIQGPPDYESGALTN